MIVGAGPAGFAASLAALERKLRFVTLEQESIGGTVAHYPRGKIVMTRPVKLPIVGKTRIKETTKESLLSFWQDVEKRTGLQVNYGERVESVTAEADGFVVQTSRDSYRTRAVLLAIGRRGTPRKLEVAGEDLPKVVYRLIDPAQYDGKHVLVVGGGDSALEAAVALAERRHDRHPFVSRRRILSGAADEPRSLARRRGERTRRRIARVGGRANRRDGRDHRAPGRRACSTERCGHRVYRRGAAHAVPA